MTRLHALAEDPDTRAVVLTGSGEVFYAGFDLKELRDGDAARIFADARTYHHAVHTFPKPLVAAINGPALAGGMNLAAMCDFRVAGMRAEVGGVSRYEWQTIDLAEYPNVKRGIEFVVIDYELEDEAGTLIRKSRDRIALGVERVDRPDTPGH